jgi:peptidyl-prolyl cis-trans isomerase D
MNTLVLRHEADALGITTTDDEIVTAIQQLPVFQTNGAYDSSKYNQFISNVLAPNGFSADQLEEIIRDRTRLEKLKGLIGATVPAPANEVRSTYEMRNRKTELSYVQVSWPISSRAPSDDDDLKKVSKSGRRP